ncbi:MAG: NUDIX domain-containing protein [Bacteroidia bacterium]|nr:NUDIX domain-containing protein [Bacteroidia bacterium]
MNKTKGSKYSAFINDKLIRFSDIYDKHEDTGIVGLKIVSGSSHPVSDVVESLEIKKEWKGVLYLSDSPKRSWEEFVSLFQLQEAAGGLVKNELEEYLMIFRRDKWDLPKGKIDYDESPEVAALREVREECGVEELEIVKSLQTTFHSYPHKNKKVLKKTHWYLMTGDSADILAPQLEEDIERVEWMDEQRIREEVFVNTYHSIQQLLLEYFEKK